MFTAKLIGITFLLASTTSNSSRAFAQSDPQELSVSAGFADRTSVAPDEPIEMRLNRPVQPSEGRLAIFIGQTDLTGLFAIAKDVLTYSPKVLRLPSGETEVIVYLVSPVNDWKRLAQFSLHVSNEQPGRQ